MRLFHLASDKEILKGETTDVYFVRAEEVLKAKGLEGTEVVAEVTSGSFPGGWPWAIITGIEEVVHLFKDVPVDVDVMPEGTLFRSTGLHGLRLPVISIEGPYVSFCRLETPLLGLICQSSGISTAAARIKKVAGRKPVLNFGARRMHPCLSPLIGRAAYLGGVDGISSVVAAKLLKVKPTGTMPHSLIIVFGDQVKAWKAFDEVVSKEVKRVALVDTYYDEKIEAVMAAQTLKNNLWGIRLDTPSSRKGDFAEIVREVRWELDLRGYKDVKIFVSGGLNPASVKELSEAGADGFGVGTYISNAAVIDFAMDIVEMDGKPVAKRGKLGGKKQVWRCGECLVDHVLPHSSSNPSCPTCGSATEPLLKPLIRNGKIVAELPEASKIRDFVLEQLEKVALD